MVGEVRLFMRPASSDTEADMHTLTQLLVGGAGLSSVAASSSDAFFEELRGQGSRQVCQYQFKRGDIVWVCTTCQRDETCVLCNPCFMRTNHSERFPTHEVFFYHSQAGGCCDCGDFGAWCSDGFCDRHGHVQADDPVSTVQPQLAQAGAVVLAALAEELAAFAEDYAQSYSLDFLDRLCDDEGAAVAEGEEVEKDEEEYALCVQRDDVHGEAAVTAALVTAGLSRGNVGPVWMQLAACGTALLPVPKAARKRAASAVALKTTAVLLRGSGLKVNVVGDRLSAREQRVRMVIAWLAQLAQTNDGMGRLVCVSLSVPLLLRMIQVDPFLPRTVAVPLHNLYLTLMSDQSFKLSLAVGYAKSYRAVARAYGQGYGTAESSIYSLSVQFLNREVFVADIVRDHGFFERVICAVEEMLFLTFQEAERVACEGRGNDGPVDPTRFTSSLLKNPALLHRRYNALYSDLKVVFAIPGMSRMLLAAALPAWLRILARCQMVHTQTREMRQHVAFESNEWISAFNLYLGVGILFEYLNNWLDVATASEDVPVSSFASLMSSADQYRLADAEAYASDAGDDVTSGSPASASSFVDSLGIFDEAAARAPFFVNWSLKSRAGWAWDTTALPSAHSVLTTTLDATVVWQVWYRRHFEQPALKSMPSRRRPLPFVLRAPAGPSRGVVVCLPPAVSTSFHLFLHRYVDLGR
jgi:hypothetical protein